MVAGEPPAAGVLDGTPGDEATGCADDVDATVGGTAASVTSWSETEIVAVAPAGLDSGAVSVGVTPAGSTTTITIGTFTITGTTTTDPPPDPPVVDSFTASPSTVNLEDKITLKWKVRPKIKSFTASPSSIQRGQSSTLEWETVNATTVTLGGSTVPYKGTRIVQPWNAEDHDYTLSASNADASVSATATVTVSLPPAPVIHSLSPRQGVPDSETTISGANFSSTHRGSVSFGGATAEINSWGNTSVSVQVPGQLGRGQVTVSLSVLGQTSNSVTFTVTGDPVQRDCPEDDEECEEEEEEEECDEDDKECEEKDGEEEEGDGDDGSDP